MQGVSLSPEAERIFQVADTLCYRLGLAIVTPEHVLAAALIILSETGVTGLPSAEALIEATVTVHGSSDEPLANDVMWGSAARDALSATVRDAAASGTAIIDPRAFVLGVLNSGHANPGFLAAAGTTGEGIRAALNG